MDKEFEAKYMQKFEKLYNQKLVESMQKIKDGMSDEIFWDSRHKGCAFAYKVRVLKDEIRQDLSRVKKAEEKMYYQRLAEGREKISEKINSQIFFTPGTEGQAFACKVKKLEEELREDLLSIGNENLFSA